MVSPLRVWCDAPGSVLIEYKKESCWRNPSKALRTI